LSEREKVPDPLHLQRTIAGFRSMGFAVAIDDFGAGNAGLCLLADLHVEIVKLDMGLVRNCDADRTRRIILGSVAGACRALGIEVVAEGVETAAEYAALREMGIGLFQGYFFARPAFRALPVPHLPPV
jgi:EAL domain-containing protein (putative c-di-GMP-specific phosphodiesterase class I)